MIKNSPKPSYLQTYLRGHKRALSEGFIMPWKSPLKSLMTILTLSICFYIPLFLWTLWLNYDELKQSWQNQGSIAIFVKSGLDLKEAGILLQEIKENDIVQTATIQNSEEIKNQLASDVQLSQFIELINTHDLPQQINIKMRETTTVEDIEVFVNTYEINPQIEYVSYDKQWLGQLQALTNTLLQMARISALMFILIVMVILGNTIANEITDHKSELRLLELIGATWAQVRRSFLYMGVFIGIYAGLLAVLFLNISFWWLEDTLGGLVKNFGIDISLHALSFSQICLVLILSIAVTWLAARLTLSSQSLNQMKD
jgi:cell division transport system permease protein